MQRVLMCEPKYYDVVYEINPWMTRKIPVKTNLAKEQWQILKATIEKCGATVMLVAPVAGLPDMVFTANAGLVVDKKFFPAHFKYPERQGEREHFIKWFREAGFEICDQENQPLHYFEGAGDALFAGKKLFAAYGFRSDKTIYDDVAKIGDFDIVYCELVDPYYYHLDTCFCPLNGEQAIIWPSAFTQLSLQRLAKEIKLLPIPEAEAKLFACNAVVLKNHVIIPSGCPVTREILEKEGFTVHDCSMTEYIKAGGACKCLTLLLDGAASSKFKN